MLVWNEQEPLSEEESQVTATFRREVSRVEDFDITSGGGLVRQLADVAVYTLQLNTTPRLLRIHTHPLLAPSGASAGAGVAEEQLPTQRTVENLNV